MKAKNESGFCYIGGSFDLTCIAQLNTLNKLLIVSVFYGLIVMGQRES